MSHAKLKSTESLTSFYAKPFHVNEMLNLSIVELFTFSIRNKILCIELFSVPLKDFLRVLSRGKHLRNKLLDGIKPLLV